MKTAISLPDEAFTRITHEAEALGMSRSELFVTAAIAYLDSIASTRRTQAINDALATMEPDDSDHEITAVNRAKLAAMTDEW